MSHSFGRYERRGIVERLLYFSIVLLALLRCCHYAYLKYKYAYEDYLYVLSAQAQAENTETP